MHTLDKAHTQTYPRTMGMDKWGGKGVGKLVDTHGLPLPKYTRWDVP
jgi:hypothetical protein